MNSPALCVRMLGDFSIRRGAAEVTVGRSRKLALLLALLIRQRTRPVPYGELMDQLWPGQEAAGGSLNALKAVLHRARACLDQLGEGFGRELILSRDSCFQWNPDVPVVLDAEEFSLLCRKSGQVKRPERKLDLQVQALALYQGKFLPVLLGVPWAASKARELHQLYLNTVLEALPLLTAQERWQEAAQLSGAAFALEPCREDLCRWRLEALLRLNRQQEAVQIYEGLHQRLLSQTGALPSESLRELYRQAQRDREPRAISPIVLLEQLREAPQSGALLCEYDFFRAICHNMSRIAERTGNHLHIALISLAGEEDSLLAQHSLNRAMGNLQEIIRACLRRGDVFSQCSSSQFVLLLPEATYENSCMICTRITRAFTRQYPHSPAQLQSYVQPLLPAPNL